jgi:hypothetical protein
VDLHNREAVVTPAQGEGLADMVGNAIRNASAQGGDMSGVVGELRGMKNALAHQNATLLAGMREMVAQMAIA